MVNSGIQAMALLALASHRCALAASQAKQCAMTREDFLAMCGTAFDEAWDPHSTVDVEAARDSGMSMSLKVGTVQVTGPSEEDMAAAWRSGMEAAPRPRPMLPLAADLVGEEIAGINVPVVSDESRIALGPPEAPETDI